MIPIILLTLCIGLALGRTLPDQHIVGGSTANLGEWPWQGALYRSPHNTLYCGAVLLSDTYALSSATCAKFGAASYYVYFGIFDKFLTFGYPEVYFLSNITMHPNFIEDEDEMYPNDIAILQLEKPVNLSNPYIDYIQMASNPGQDWMGEECWVTGWGRSFAGGVTPNVLMKSQMDVLTTNDCQVFWNTDKINDTQLCLLDQTDRYTTTCEGDEGGPVSCRSGGKWHLAGIVSFHTDVCTGFQPVVTTRITSYYQWIIDTIL